MRRPVRGIQLGRRPRPALLRAAEAACLFLALAAAWGGISLQRVRTQLERLPPASGVSERPGDAAPPDADLVRRAAALLRSGALAAPGYAPVFEAIREATPAGVLVTAIEARPGAGQGRVQADISADAVSGAAVARLLAALAEADRVLATEMIRESLETGGGAAVRITADFDAR